MNDSEVIYVTRPILPGIEDVFKEIADIWKSRNVTNMGPKHEELEEQLQAELDVPNLSLFNNGTTALLAAIKAMELPEGSEVITTPFTFAATPHCIFMCGLFPVFCDIDPETMCINPENIEKLITSKTSAILGVHVYGFPCDVEKIQQIADRYGLRVIYDAAHAFSTKINGKSIGSFGDISMYSFHATKLFNTIEGGCLSCNDNKLHKKIRNIRNFGIINEDLVEEVGVNGKMNEIQAAIGLLNLKNYKNEQVKRKRVKMFYDDSLSHISGIKIPKKQAYVTDSFQYYPIIVNDDFPISRDALYLKFKEHNIFTRRYFYPICSDFECYKNLESSDPENLPVANYLKSRVLCLPFYGDLSDNDLERIVTVLEED